MPQDLISLFTFVQLDHKESRDFKAQIIFFLKTKNYSTAMYKLYLIIHRLDFSVK